MSILVKTYLVGVDSRFIDLDLVENKNQILFEIDPDNNDDIVMKGAIDLNINEEMFLEKGRDNIWDMVTFWDHILYSLKAYIAKGWPRDIGGEGFGTNKLYLITYQVRKEILFIQSFPDLREQHADRLDFIVAMAKEAKKYFEKMQSLFPEMTIWDIVLPKADELANLEYL